jgi:hypothetical protein
MTYSVCLRKEDFSKSSDRTKPFSTRTGDIRPTVRKRASGMKLPGDTVDPRLRSDPAPSIVVVAACHPQGRRRDD